MSSLEIKPESVGKCKTQLELYIKDLNANVLAWYEREASKHYRRWFLCFWTSIVAGFASSLIAAFVKARVLTDYGPNALIVLPALGALAGLILSQFHFRELEDLRERGRIEDQDIIDWARGQFAAAAEEKECLAVYEQLREKIKQLESWQHKDFIAINSLQRSSKGLS